MRKIAQHILVCATLCFSLLSCNVHQWPEAPIPEVDVNLTLTFDTDMPLLAIIDRMNTYASTDPEDYDVRYRINAYRISDNGSVSTKPTKEWIFSRPEIAVLDYSTPVSIAPGNYRLYAWADYVENNSVEDKFYSTNEFTGISILGSKHIGNNDFRDAFIGTTDIAVVEQFELDLPPIEAHIKMGRPLAKFNFISTDLEEFISRVLEARLQQAAADGIVLPDADLTPSSVDLSEFRITVRYAGFMPCEFNMFSDAPVDSRTNVMFDSNITPLSGSEAMLGFDYVFVNGQQSTILISLSVYDKDGVLMSAVPNIEVPVERSKLTTIRGHFMTESAQGGVNLKTEFDGEFNIYM
ncbi:MAG: hypothetical protein IJZ67_07230 [Alistipes sp.]|nr:hypothetical protein [Alistipes sp.]